MAAIDFSAEVERTFEAIENSELISAHNTTLLKDGGLFRLRDFIFSFDPEHSCEKIDRWIKENKESTAFTEEEIHRHFRDEYSTYGFLMESMLEQVGFNILDTTYDGDFYAMYTCRWEGNESR